MIIIQNIAVNLNASFFAQECKKKLHLVFQLNLKINFIKSDLLNSYCVVVSTGISKRLERKCWVTVTQFASKEAIAHTSHSPQQNDYIRYEQGLSSNVMQTHEGRILLCMRKTRVQQINEYLMQNVKTIYRLRKIGHAELGEKKSYAYAVSLVKVHSLTLEKQVAAFCAACKQMLREGEVLVTENRSFRIVSDAYDVTYCVEAWRKKADKVCYVQKGEVKIDFLHRMSCEQAAKIYKKKGISPLQAVAASEMLREIKNPADRYVALRKYIDEL